MHWRWFVPFPLAAFLCGQAVRAPALKPALEAVSPGCPGYEQARASYLLAYGYRLEEPARSRSYVNESLALIKECPGPAAGRLRTRGKELRANLGESL
jgi:hypothetical protein